MRLLLSFVISILITHQGKSQQFNVNVLDSNSVNIFIKNSSVCEQIQAALNFSENIAQEKGYGIKLLEALSKNTGYSLYIPIGGPYGILYTISQRTESLKEQLIELQNKIGVTEKASEHGDTAKTYVPYLIGTTYKQAESILKSMGLKLKTNLYPTGIDEHNIQDCIIYKQNPTSRRNGRKRVVSRGQLINVSVKNAFKSIQEMCKEVLEINKSDSVFIFNSSDKKDEYAETFLTFLGTVKTTDNRSFKIITYKFVWGPNRHTSGSIYIFNEKNQYVGIYGLGGASDLPSHLKNDCLIFTNDDNSSCDNNLKTVINLKKGLPKNIFIKCQGKYGDVYSFSSDD